MRRRLLDQLGEVPHRRFLVYVMGPYKSFPVEELRGDDTGVDFGGGEEQERSREKGQQADGQRADGQRADGQQEDGDQGEVDEVLDLLLRVRDRLRTEPGVNAFLATDADVPLSEMDAATQTIEFARASNVVLFVAPLVGRNLGVGIETGAVLEDVAAGDDHRRERVVFVHEEGVQSAMIAGVARRWDAAVYSYADEDELVKRVRQFVANVMNRELAGELPTLDEE